MPVRVVPSKHEANPISPLIAQSAEDALTLLLRGNHGEVFQSSLDGESLPSALQSSNNGFVQSIVTAYNKHHHLRFRPDDIWFAILTQFSMYVNGHAEKLRSQFVAHQDQKHLVLSYDGDDRWSFDFSVFAKDMSRLIEENVLDPELRTWMMPNFSTSTAKDTIVASIVMMGSMQKYFTYECRFECGIPSVTLLGEKEDWERLVQKIAKLDEFGEEPREFSGKLRPILGRFVRSFENPTSPELIHFWQQILDVKRGSGMCTYSGWVTAFCFWNEKGQRVGGRRRAGLTLDGIEYYGVEKSDVPAGWIKVPVLINDNGKKIEAEMAAGSIGISCSSSGVTTKPKDVSIQLDTMEPETAWWIYERKPTSDLKVIEPGSLLDGDDFDFDYD